MVMPVKDYSEYPLICCISRVELHGPGLRASGAHGKLLGRNNVPAHRVVLEVSESSGNPIVCEYNSILIHPTVPLVIIVDIETHIET